MNVEDMTVPPEGENILNAPCWLARYLYIGGNIILIDSWAGQVYGQGLELTVMSPTKMAALEWYGLVSYYD